MAIVSKFVRGSATVDLNDTTSGFSLAGTGWLPTVATPTSRGDPPPVVETLHLLLTDSSQDNMAADMQALHAMQVWAEEYINDPTVIEPVWFHAKMNSETYERRAVVYKIDVQYGASWYGEEATALDIPVTITVTRGPYWESVSLFGIPSSLNNNGVVVPYTYYSATNALIEGDAPARIAFFYAEAELSTTYWFGTRSTNKHGDVAEFYPLWEFEDGTNSADVSDVADTGASGGSKIVADGSATGTTWDNTWNYVSTIKYADICTGGASYYQYQKGMFFNLTRLRVTSGEWEVQFNYGQEDDLYFEGNIVSVGHADWRIREFDVYKVPPLNQKAVPTPYRGDNTVLADYVVKAQAQRISGTGNLEMDCMIPLPVDEGYLKLLGNVAKTSSDFFGVSPTGQVDAWIGSQRAAISNENISLPVGEGRMYIVVSAATAHSMTPDVDINTAAVAGCYERWYSLRGSEGVAP